MRRGSPFQLVLLMCSFALAGYAGVRLVAGDWFLVCLWFAGAALVHDLVLLPLYGAVDRGVLRVLGAVGPGDGGGREWAGHVRVPMMLSGLLLLVWFPMISGRAAEHYTSATTLSADGFLGRWLLITAALFAGSALLLPVRLRRAAKQRSSADH